MTIGFNIFIYKRNNLEMYFALKVKQLKKKEPLWKREF